MSSAAKVVAVASALLVLSLSMKLAWIPAAAALHLNELNDPQRLQAWFDATQTPVERSFLLKPGWRGWQIRLANCSAIVTPQPPFDGTELLKTLTGNDHELHYVYRGRISESPPLLDTMIGRIRNFAAPLAKQSDWLVVIVSAPKGCRDYEALDWSRL